MSAEGLTVALASLGEGERLGPSSRRPGCCSPGLSVPGRAPGVQSSRCPEVVAVVLSPGLRESEGEAG